MRIATAACFCLAHFLAFAPPVRADSFLLSSPVSDVTVYDQGAEIVRRVPFSIPVGQHELILQDLPASVDILRIRVAVEGARGGTLTMRSDFTPPRDRTKSAAELAAATRVEALERQIEGVRDRAATARLAADAAATRRQFLSDLGKADGMSEAGPDQLRAISRMIGEEALEAARSAQSGEIDARRIERALDDLADQLDDARQALAALTPETSDRAYLAVQVDADAPGDGVLTVRYYTDEASWSPVYDMRLDRKASKLAIERGALVSQASGENWTGVNLVLSTARPSEDMTPPEVYPRPRRIEDPAPAKEPRYSDTVGAAPPAMEAPVIVEQAVGLSADLSGYAVTYTYPVPVSVASDADAVRLRIDTLDLDATIRARAVAQSWTDAVFLVAHVVNTSGEEILPSLISALYVDGTFVGAASTNPIPANDDADLFFGPVKGLLVSRVVKGENEGNSGIISRSNEQSETARITLRNLTDEEWPVTVIDQVPYSTQDDLQITWRADPRPSVTDWEDKRGVMAWDITLAPGAARDITLSHTLSWPEGKVLR